MVQTVTESSLELCYAVKVTLKDSFTEEIPFYHLTVFEVRAVSVEK